jgi:hypothetical protein
MGSIFNFSDRIYRIIRITFGLFPDENGQAQSPSANRYIIIFSDHQALGYGKNITPKDDRV